jgi:hypothetical protein
VVYTAVDVSKPRIPARGLKLNDGRYECQQNALAAVSKPRIPARGLKRELVVRGIIAQKLDAVSKPRIPARGLKLRSNVEVEVKHPLAGIKATNPRSGTETAMVAKGKPTASNAYQSHESPLGD